MVDGEREPGRRVRGPQALLMTARINTEQVRDTLVVVEDHAAAQILAVAVAAFLLPARVLF